MTDQEQNKLHPFAGYLQPDETLLWHYSPNPRPLTWKRNRAIFVADRDEDGCLPSIARLFKRLGLPFRPQRAFPISYFAYGVTNRRLLRRTDNKIVGKPLNKFQIPPKIIYQGSRATLNLGRTSWWWRDIERDEAERALQIIEQASQAMRM